MFEYKNYSYAIIFRREYKEYKLGERRDGKTLENLSFINIKM